MAFTLAPYVCLGENLVTDDAGQLTIAPWAVPRLVYDQRYPSTGDTASLAPQVALPGQLLIDDQFSWNNDAPLAQQALIRCTRASKTWVTANPNAIQFRDRWSWAINFPASPPTTTGLFNEQVGSAIDTGTNTVAEPNPGLSYMWNDANTEDEWVFPTLQPGDTLNVHYREYVWTPPPYSDNANKDAPVAQAAAGWSRMQLWIYPQQGTVVTG